MSGPWGLEGYGTLARVSASALRPERWPENPLMAETRGLRQRLQPGRDIRADGRVARIRARGS